MRAVDIIATKRDGKELSDEQIRWFIEKYTDDTLPDYQAAALLMAIFLRGMSARETATLTAAMAHSGQMLDLTEFGRTVDKHSSGGVGDKTTLVVGPIVASTGLPVAKMSGRGLGFSGGTLDKLESIAGLRVNLSLAEFLDQVRRVGLVVASQTAELAPADGRLYALRDVTATVDSLPLIASSIMSKKLAAGATAIVLDVKVGAGAFMQTLDAGRALAETMVAIGAHMDREVTALLSDMNQPLGRAVGNALEVAEAIATLHGDGPEDFTTHCLTVAAHMLLLGNKAGSLDGAYDLAEHYLVSGAAWEKFVGFVEAQGGERAVIEQPHERLPHAAVIEPLLSPRAATVAAINARAVGMTVVELGGGRAKKGDMIDPTVGVVLAAKVGDAVSPGQMLLEVHAATLASAEAARERLLAAFEFSDGPVEPPPLFYDGISTRTELNDGGKNHGKSKGICDARHP
ncbi:MAG: thymidine phosphorylase [Ardenticatenaceae bacterium]|nr:thymidine phosphorylase [Ardenticatenaceae bacterium]